MKNRSFALALGLSLFMSVLAVAPASAEIEGPPTNAWGVEELLTGTQNDSIRSYVFAIEQIGDRIYVGGRFGDVTDGNTPIDQPYLAAFDATTGLWISTFTPVLNGSVNALQAAPDGSRLFVGGDFTTVNGQPADTLVAIDPITGAIDNGFGGAVTGASTVRDFALEGPWLYVVGGFNGVISPVGNNLSVKAARFDWQSGNHDPNWRPDVGGGTPWGVAASSADRVYLAGTFNTVGGNLVTGGFAAVTKTDATYVPPSEPFPVNTQNVARQYLYDVEVVNGFVFAAGSEHFVAVLNESDQSLHRFHYSRPRGDYQDLEVVGDRVYSGCHCRVGSFIDSSNDVLWFGPPPAGVPNGVADATYSNTWITAFSAVTGEIDPSFIPPLTATRAGVWAIHGSPDGCLWLGGDISSAGGQSADNIVRLCDAAAADTERPTPPGAPQIVGQTVDSVDFTWAASTDNVAVTGYDVYDAATDIVVATVAGTSGTVTGLAPGNHSFYVKAFDAASNTSWRSGISTVTLGAVVDTQRPTPPTGLAVVAVGADSVDLSWNPSNDNVAVTGYNVYDSTTNQILVTVTGTTATVPGLTPGTYGFYVKAFDAANNTSWRSNIESATVGAAVDTERPTPPTGLAVVAVGADSVDLSWNPSNDNVAVTGYNIYDSTTNQILVTVTGTTATVPGLTPGTYGFYVKAFDAANNTSWRSNIESATVV